MCFWLYFIDKRIVSEAISVTKKKKWKRYHRLKSLNPKHHCSESTFLKLYFYNCKWKTLCISTLLNFIVFYFNFFVIGKVFRNTFVLWFKYTQAEKNLVSSLNFNCFMLLSTNISVFSLSQKHYFVLCNMNYVYFQMLFLISKLIPKPFRSRSILRPEAISFSWNSIIINVTYIK